jgi:hypothetical protein
MMSEIDDLRRQLADTRQAWQDCREDVTTLRQELDEARVALKGTDDISCFLTWDMWADKYAAALQAAREAKP